MTRSTIFAACLFMALGAACNKEEPAPEKAAETPTTPAEKPATPAPTAAAPAPLSDEPTTQVSGLPTPEDYETEAEGKISAGNLETELDKLEKEIESE
jgi:hypothetical protein